MAVHSEALSGVSDVATGNQHALALKNGRVIAWGTASAYGQASAPAEAQAGVTAIAAGGGHSLALKDGRVIAWGADYEGQASVPAAAQSGVGEPGTFSASAEEFSAVPIVTFSFSKRPRE